MSSLANSGPIDTHFTGRQSPDDLDASLDSQRVITDAEMDWLFVEEQERRDTQARPATSLAIDAYAAALVSYHAKRLDMLRAASDFLNRSDDDPDQLPLFA